MLKRMTKVTSLLVCAASIISIVPATAADVKKYDTQEGTVYNAKAKGVGIYIDGAVNGKDEDVYFMTPDGKYNVLDGVDTGLGVDDLLLNQYLLIDDGDNVVDIKNNYKVTDENTRADIQDDIASTLRSKIRNDDDGRFDETTFKGTTITPLVKIQAAGSGLSNFNYALDSSNIITLASGTKIKTTDAVYSDATGKYVDADYNLGSVKITTTPGGSISVTLKNTEDAYDVTDNNVDYEYRAFTKDLGKDSYITDIGDYIYRWADLSIYRKAKGAADSTYVNVTTQVGFGAKGYNAFVPASATSVRVFQKFSKTPSTDNVDGIKYSKDAATYFIADEDGKTEVILGGKDTAATATKVNGSATGAKTKITGNDKGFCSAFLDVTANGGKGKLYAQNLQLKSKEGFNYVDLGDTDDTDSDIANTFNTGGVMYVLNGGYVKAWDTEKESFEKVYKVDGSLDNMSIGSKDFMILWSEDDEVYTIINNKKDAAATTATTTGAAVGWVQAADKTWSFAKADGTKSTSWFQDTTGTWYFAKAEGTMVANGWAQSGSAWYYLGATGAMATNQWIQSGADWYYVGSTGAMLTNTVVDGYQLGASGAWVK